jgi:hypothetical protein
MSPDGIPAAERAKPGPAIGKGGNREGRWRGRTQYHALGVRMLKWVAPLIRRGFVSEACEVDGAGGVEGLLGCAYR